MAARNPRTKVKTQEWEDKIEREVNLGSAWAHKVTQEIVSTAHKLATTPDGQSLAIQDIVAHECRMGQVVADQRYPDTP